MGNKDRGKREVKKSLTTTDVREAKRRGMEVAAEVDRLFETARNGIDLSAANAEAMARAWKEKALAESADLLAMGGAESTEEAERVAALLRRWNGAMQSALVTGRSQQVMDATAKRLLAEQGIALPLGSDGFKRLCLMSRPSIRRYSKDMAIPLRSATPRKARWTTLTVGSLPRTIGAPPITSR